MRVRSLCEVIQVVKQRGEGDQNECYQVSDLFMGIINHESQSMGTRDPSVNICSKSTSPMMTTPSQGASLDAIDRTFQVPLRTKRRKVQVGEGSVFWGLSVDPVIQPPCYARQVWATQRESLTFQPTLSFFHFLL